MGKHGDGRYRTTQLSLATQSSGVACSIYKKVCAMEPANVLDGSREAATQTLQRRAGNALRLSRRRET
jgi:hypothetical protein